ncbi:endonuclease/exonuclease/phosphatase family protein [Flavilitoribacter nigricans]|uniref:Endonuclease/exonuclease/phosphatase domain-containing protein n=1 Tax=Flavilitoribacter nigricans (strain ATCC 23147 / DSM 23189 / NBRC 102662 / NCIMB 1420 / SS-2) TaxID=1122177 RepID=A0A2D0N2H3_FLAN2|nr:hypothetical protein [Flavilitoribacter nigricans]PHN02695.1 hypothetical protein CRP01_30390 [Flavilitoribacter nigricans DSM 23189 = NBRC 102662]
MHSVREIAEKMDELLPPRTLRGLLALHRWVDATGVPSLREIMDRHHGSVSKKMLFYNTYLLPGVEYSIGKLGDAFLPDIEPAPIGAIPEIDSRREEIARAIQREEYDIAALCEVFRESEQQALRRPWPDGSLTTVAGPAELIDIEVPIPPMLWDTIRHTLQHLPVAGSFLKPFANLLGPFGHLLRPTLKGTTQSSGLFLMGRDIPFTSAATHVFESKGEATKDADFWASKGVLRVVIPFSGGNIELYCTHIHSGGSLLDETLTEEDRDRVKTDQYRELREFIQAHKQPEHIAILVGDFNRDGFNLEEPRYQALVEEMERVNLYDLWPQRGFDADGNVLPGATYMGDDESYVYREHGETICTLDGHRCNDLIPQRDPNRSRLDYIFVERPSEAHSLNLDFTRPRRVNFTREGSGGEMFYLSDHLGLETTLIVSRKI